MKKENKRKFNIFVSILTCFVITLACLSPSFIAFASEPITTISVTYYKFTDNYNINGEFITDIGSDESLAFITSFSDFVSSNGFYVPSGSIYDTSVFDNYVIMGQSSGTFNPDTTRYKFFQAPSDSFICRYELDNTIYFQLAIPSGYITSNSYIYSSFQFKNNADFSTVEGSVTSRSGIVSTVPFVGGILSKNIDGIDYNCISLSFDSYGTPGQPYMTAVNSSLPLYDGEFSEITSLEDLENKNNTMSSGGYSEANILDNLYLGSNNNIYMSGSKVNSSILHILLDFNRNQMEQKNIDTDKLTYDIHMDWIVQGTCTADSKSRQMLNYYFGDGTANWWDNLNGKTYNFNTAFQGSWSGLTCSNVNEISSTIYNDGIYTNGKTATTMANYLSGAVNTGNTVSDVKSFFDSFSDLNIAGYSINSMTNSNHTSLTTCYYDVTVDVFYDGEKINDSPITGRCDWLNGSQEMLSNVSSADVSQALANNNNGLPVTDPNYKDPNGYKGTIQIVDNSTGGSGGSGGNIESGAIVINNNPTFNNNTSSSSSSFGSGGIIGFILGAIIGNNKSSSDTITSMTGANGWLEVISSTWGWIPTQIWSVLITTFTAVIGIIVVAFIISIVIRFIT